MTPVTLLTPSRLGASFVRFVTLFCFITGLALAASVADAPKQSFDVPAAPAEKALRDFSQQAGLQVLFSSDVAKGVQTKAVKGEMTALEALDTMLADTGLVVVKDPKTEAFSIRKETPAEAKNGSSRPESDRAAGDKVEGGVIKLETFEVMGSKLLNMDIRRTRDDPQPYVTYDRAVIEHSGASNLEEFLKTRLTMNTVASTNSQQFGIGGGNTSQINLRGLGTNQTLILIDGRRAPTNTNVQGALGQPDVNGIPMAAIERIEVLPATASGIYGGGATGGVVNIVLRRDYSGAEVKLTYEDSFSSNSAIRRVDFSAGVNLNGGKTSILLAGSYAKQAALSVQDREFVQQYDDRRLRNVNGNLTALFGANPLTGFNAAEPNIRSASGANLVLKTGTALNSAITSVPTGYRGVASDNGAGLVASAGRYNTTVGIGYDSFYGGFLHLLNASEVKSLLMSARHQFSSRLEGFFEVSESRNKSTIPRNGTPTRNYSISASSPTNPFTEDILVSFSLPQQFASINETRVQKLLGGVILRLPSDWTAEFDYMWSRNRQSYVDTSPVDQNAGVPGFRTAVQTGVVDLLMDPSLYTFNPFAYDPTAIGNVSTIPPEFTQRDATLRFSGRPIAPFGSPLTLSGYVEHLENATSAAAFRISNTNNQVFAARSQRTDSVYLELHQPLLGKNADGGDFLTLQAAGRYDRYRTNGVSNFVLNAAVPVRATNRLESSNPTIALLFQPDSQISFRTSYGRGFLPPNTNQLASNAPFLGSAFDPRRGNEPTPNFTVIAGGNPNLGPEKSESFSAGAILKWKTLPGLRLSVDYVRIHKTDAITTLTNQQILDNESLFPGRVTRGPKLATDPANYAGPVTSVDDTSVNIAIAQVEAYDFQADYSVKLANSRLDFYALGTFQTKLITQIAPTLAKIQNVDFANQPLRWKTNAGVTWVSGPWTVGWSAHFFDSHWVYAATDTPSTRNTLIAQEGDRRVASQIYHDLFASYRFARGSRDHWWTAMLNGTEVSVGAKNVFGKVPPFDVNSGRLYSSYGDPRLASYFLSAKRSF